MSNYSEDFEEQNYSGDEREKLNSSGNIKKENEKISNEDSSSEQNLKTPDYYYSEFSTAKQPLMPNQSNQQNYKQSGKNQLRQNQSDNQDNESSSSLYTQSQSKLQNKKNQKQNSNELLSQRQTSKEKHPNYESSQYSELYDSQQSINRSQKKETRGQRKVSSQIGEQFDKRQELESLKKENYQLQQKLKLLSEQIGKIYEKDQKNKSVKIDNSDKVIQEQLAIALKKMKNYENEYKKVAQKYQQYTDISYPISLEKQIKEKKQKIQKIEMIVKASMSKKCTNEKQILIQELNDESKKYEERTQNLLVYQEKIEKLQQDQNKTTVEFRKKIEMEPELKKNCEKLEKLAREMGILEVSKEQKEVNDQVDSFQKQKQYLQTLITEAEKQTKRAEFRLLKQLKDLYAQQEELKTQFEAKKQEIEILGLEKQDLQLLREQYINKNSNSGLPLYENYDSTPKRDKTQQLKKSNLFVEKNNKSLNQHKTQKSMKNLKYELKRSQSPLKSQQVKSAISTPKISGNFVQKQINQKNQIKNELEVSKSQPAQFPKQKTEDSQVKAQLVNETQNKIQQVKVEDKNVAEVDQNQIQNAKQQEEKQQQTAFSKPVLRKKQNNQNNTEIIQQGNNIQSVQTVGYQNNQQSQQPENLNKKEKEEKIQGSQNILQNNTVVQSNQQYQQNSALNNQQTQFTKPNLKIAKDQYKQVLQNQANIQSQSSISEKSQDNYTLFDNDQNDHYQKPNKQKIETQQNQAQQIISKQDNYSNNQMQDQKQEQLIQTMEIGASRRRKLENPDTKVNQNNDNYMNFNHQDVSTSQNQYNFYQQQQNYSKEINQPKEQNYNENFQQFNVSNRQKPKLFNDQVDSENNQYQYNQNKITAQSTKNYQLFDQNEQQQNEVKKLGRDRSHLTQQEPYELFGKDLDLQ